MTHGAVCGWRIRGECDRLMSCIIERGMAFAVPHMLLRRPACLIAVLALKACATPPTSVPGHLESHHHVRFQNGYVRVMETRLESGEETLPHSHPVDAAVIFLTNGQMRIRNDDGTTRDASVQRDTVTFGTSDIVHRVGNIGEQTVRVITVEIFSQPPSLGSATQLPSFGESLLENDKVRMSRIRVLPDEVTGVSGAMPSVIVAGTGGTVISGSIATTLRAGGVQWCDAGALELRNDGEAVFEAFIVMLKPRT